MKEQLTDQQLTEAKKRYANARRRARFWSGNPSFNRNARTVKTSSSVRSEKYELAMCDCKSWEITIHQLTGKAVNHYDPRSEFARKWSLLMGKVKR